jgi:Gas vesicle synthesis protein GvpO
MSDERAKSSANGRKPSPAAMARQACADLAELIGHRPEGVVSLERTDEGWLIGVEVLEIHRVPDTSDVLAEYEVESDEDGNLVGYRRLRRYTRGQLQDDR